jgi:hypothetical protein
VQPSRCSPRPPRATLPSCRRRASAVRAASRPAMRLYSRNLVSNPRECRGSLTRALLCVRSSGAAAGHVGAAAAPGGARAAAAAAAAAAVRRSSDRSSRPAASLPCRSRADRACSRRVRRRAVIRAPSASMVATGPGLFTQSNPEDRRVVPDEVGDRAVFKVVYVVLESQYQSSISAACKRINAGQVRAPRARSPHAPASCLPLACDGDLSPQTASPRSVLMIAHRICCRWRSQPDVAVECSGYILEELRDPDNFAQFKKDVEAANIFIGSLIFVQARTADARRGQSHARHVHVSASAVCSHTSTRGRTRAGAHTRTRACPRACVRARSREAYTRVHPRRRSRWCQVAPPERPPPRG